MFVLLPLFMGRVYFAVLIIILIAAAIYLVDEFEEERPLIYIATVTLLVSAIIIGIAVFKVSYHHQCPTCGRDLGNRGDIVSRQAIMVVP